MLGRVGLVCLFAAFAASASAAPEWRRYVNARFGVSADAPRDWQAQPPPENGDGATFVSPDGVAKILVFGRLRTEASLVQALESATEPADGEKITYIKRGARSFTASGLGGDLIFYRHAILSCADKVWNFVEIDYPIKDKAAYDALVAHVAASLRAGRPADMACR